MTDLEDRAMDLFAEVVGLSPEQRGARLDAECAAVPELRARVEELLAHDREAETEAFLERPPPAWIIGVPASLPDFGQLERIRYRGHGGMGVVYKAFDRGLGIDVALKTPLPGHLSDEGIVRIFPTDGRSMARLKHPHIVHVHRVDKHEGRPYFTMDWIDGESLDKGLGEFRQDPRAAAKLLVKVARAIHHAHQRGVLHRDLKPANILLDKGGEPLVTDFGLAKQVGAGECLVEMAAPLDTVSRVFQGIVGSIPYMSPEQATRGQDVTTASDVYGLGATLYALLTGRPPFRAATPEETLRQVRETKPVCPCKLNPAVDGALARICLKCLEKEQDDRYPSAAELAAELETYLTGGIIPPEPWWKWLWRELQSPCRIDPPREWARVFRVVAAWRVICHGMMALLLQWGPAPVGYWAWFMGLHIGGTWLPVRVLRRSQRRLGPTERSVLLNWAATLACDALLLGIFCPPWGQAGPEEVVRVYPAWLAVRGLWYVMEAQRFWGRFYAVGFGFLAFTPLLSLCGLLAPVAYALVVACAALLLSEGFRRQATAHTLAASAGDRT